MSSLMASFSMAESEVEGLRAWVRRAESSLSGRFREPRCSALKGGFLLGADIIRVDLCLLSIECGP